jgi:hypothetical protein
MIVSFKEYEDKEAKLKYYKSRILKLIDKFILSNDEFRDIHASEQMKNYLKAIDFYNDRQRGGGFVVKYYYNKYGTPDEVYFTSNQYLELLEFMKNPELYINANKFNL